LYLKIFKIGVSMFTMKKFAILATVGFMTSLMVACGDEPEEDCTENPNAPECQEPAPPSGDVWTLSDIAGNGWFAKKRIVLGGANASKGSFADIDAIFDNGTIEYGVGTVGSVKDKIDLIFDGTNLFTPTGCAASCPSNLKSAIAGSTSGSVFYTVPSTVTNMSASAIYNAYGSNASIQTNSVVVAPKGVYYMQTSANWYALILVGEQNPEGNQTIEILIGYDHD
jgi:hypothetical protein